jgi:hypothetical protein
MEGNFFLKGQSGGGIFLKSRSTSSNKLDTGEKNWEPGIPFWIYVQIIFSARVKVWEVFEKIGSPV